MKLLPGAFSDKNKGAEWSMGLPFRLQFSRWAKKFSPCNSSYLISLETKSFGSRVKTLKKYDTKIGIILDSKRR